MKRMHIHVGVENLAESIRFYSALFGVAPVKTKQEYAKWMLDDPCVNFAISTRVTSGVDHLGLQVDDETELEALRLRLKQADMTLFDEGETVCCYARSDKSWLTDPDGIAWEAYQTMQDAQLFAASRTTSTCCAPNTKSNSSRCAPAEKSAGCCS